MLKKVLTMVFPLLLIAVSAGAQQMDRGYLTKGRRDLVFAPKGSWFLGGSAGFSNHDHDSYSITVLEGVDSKGYKLNVDPTFGYLIKDNVAAGVKLSYGRNYLDLDSASLSVAGTDLSWNDYFLLEHNMAASLFLRNYIPIGNSGRLAVYVDLQLTGKGGQGKVIDDRKGDMTGTYTKRHGASISVNPGGALLLSKHFGIDASIKVLNVGYDVTSQSHNQVANGEIKSADFSYNLDLLSLNLGLYYYL